MKPKTTKPNRTIADAVYSAIHDLDGAGEKEVMQRVAALRENRDADAV
jgi:hypothetical protein